MDARHLVAEVIHGVLAVPVSDILTQITEIPKDPSGFAFPVFRFRGEHSPQEFATALAAKITAQGNTGILRAEAVKGYVNIYPDPLPRIQAVLSASSQEDWGMSAEGRGKIVGLDYSSPNIAKPFGIGHLRSTSIGAALKRLWGMLGYTCVGFNHLGDWGTQFGNLMAIFVDRGDEGKMAEDPISHLYDLYVEFNKLAEEDSTWWDRGREWFVKLEHGDAQAVAYWSRFRDLSLAEFQRVYDRLGVEFDHVWGESHYQPHMDHALEVLQPLMEKSEGAQVITVENFPPCLIQKGDGTSLYATRDIAAAIHRHQMPFDKFLYVTGHAQSLHFKQVFSVLRKLEYPWADSCIHVGFGLIKGMSTRKGTLVFLNDILDHGQKLALDILKDRDWSAEEKKSVAEAIAVGAVVFQDLSRERMRDYDFDWHQMLRGLRPDEPGRTGVYLQYTGARLASLLSRHALQSQWDSALLTEPETLSLVYHLEKFPKVVQGAAREYEPAILSRYLLDLAETFNTFYAHHRVITPDVILTDSRMALVSATQKTLAKGMWILGIPQPSRM